MMHGYGGWDWFWMVPMMLFWIVILGLIVYGAVRFALRDEHRTTR